MPVKSSDNPRVFLNNVHLKGFKSIEDLSIDFQKGLNILIGKNGSGKSNFLEFLFDAVLTRSHSKPLYNYAKLTYVTEDEHSFIIEFEKQLNSKQRKNELDDIQAILEKLSVNGEVVFDSSSGYTCNFPFNGKSFSYRGNLRILFMTLGYQSAFPLYIRFGLPDNFNLECVSLPGTLKINIEQDYTSWQYPETLSFIQNIFWALESRYEDSETIKHMVDSDFQNHLQLQLPVEILDNLKRFTSIEDIRFNNNINVYHDEKVIIIENIKLDFKINGNWLPWSQLSDGTKRLFYIIAEVTNTDGLVQIEEPELGVHPHQFNLLMDFLKEQSEHKQIIISTHSPKALDHLSPDELNNILITYYDLKKGTQIRHLTGKEITKAKKYMKEVGFFSDYWLLSDLEE